MKSRFLFIVPALFALSCAGTPVKPAKPKQESGINLEVDELILDNGMKVLTVEREGVPRVFCALYWKVGSVNERPGITGLSHFFEHMMFKGTPTIGTKDAARDKGFNERIESAMGSIRELKLRGLEALRKGTPLCEEAGKVGVTLRADDEAEWKRLMGLYDAAVKEQKDITIGEHLSKIFSAAGGTGLNASTWKDWTRYFVDLPANKLELFLWMESDRFLNPVFREFYPEREVVKEERRMRTDSTPTGRINEAFESQFWQAHPYHWPVIGWMSDIDQYTYADAQRYYDTHYTPDNCTAIFVGAVKKEEVRALAMKYFARLPKAKHRRDEIVTVEPEQVAPKRMEAEADSQPSIEISWHAPSQVHSDAPALDLLALIGAGRTGRFYKNLVQGKKLALGASSQYGGMKYGGQFEISATPRPEASLEDVEKELLAVVETLRTEKVSDRELLKAKNQMLGNLVQSLDTNAGIATQLGFSDINNSWKDVFNIVPDANKVTADDVQRVARKYLVPEGKNVLIVRRKPKEPPKQPEPTKTPKSEGK